VVVWDGLDPELQYMSVVIKQFGGAEVLRC
jgi:hypothetical protein